MNIRTKHLGVAFLSMGLAAYAACGSDWPQYRGPNHDGTSSEKILTAWPGTGLKQIWKVPLKDGFSAMTVADGKIFTLVARDVDGAKQEVCVALDATSGKELWMMPLCVAKYDGGGDSGTPDNSGGDGPRSTPSYDHGKVYTYSSRMVLSCFDAVAGKLLWSSDLIKEHGGRNIHWESAASPLIDGDMVYVAGGGQGESLLAFDKNDGHVIWKGQDDAITQSSPVAANILGERQVIFFTQTGLVSVAPKTGNVLWRFPMKYKGAAGISPVVSGDVVYCSMSYGIGSSACKITKTSDGFTAASLWFQPMNALNSHWSTPVAVDGYLYGLFGQAQFGKAPLECVEIATGNVVWKQSGFGPGGCTLVDGNVMVLSDAGDLVLVKASPKAYTEVARTHILAGKCWNVASVSNGRIYARSTTEGVCVDVSP